MFSSQHMYGSIESYITPGPENSMPSSYRSTVQTYCTYIHAGKYSYTQNKINTFIFLKIKQKSMK